MVKVLRIVCLLLVCCGLYAGKAFGGLISPERLKEDLDFLFKTIEESHPDMYAYTSKDKFASLRRELFAQAAQPLSASELYVRVEPVLYCLKDSHTLVSRPPNFVRPKVTKDLKEFAKTLKKFFGDEKDSNNQREDAPIPRKTEYTGPFSYHLFPKYDTCLMVINSFGAPDEVSRYAQVFRKTFKIIKGKNIGNLIIDLRSNPGGCGLAGDELLMYLADKPFRQIEKIEQRIVSKFFELCKRYSLDIDKVMYEEYGIDVGSLKSEGKFKAGMIIAGKGQFKKPHEPSLRFTGSTYVLISHPTFSSASNFASAVECFEIGTLIGEETSGYKDHYGQVLPFQLPNSRMPGQVSTAHFLTACGKPDDQGVLPDHEVKQKPEDTAKGVDTVLQFTLDFIKGSDPVASPK